MYGQQTARQSSPIRQISENDFELYPQTGKVENQFENCDRFV